MGGAAISANMTAPSGLTLSVSNVITSAGAARVRRARITRRAMYSSNNAPSTRAT
jgi:hypothetical protein